MLKFMADQFQSTTGSWCSTAAAAAGLAVVSCDESQALDFGLLSPSNSFPWSQPLFGRGDDANSLHAFLQEDDDITRSSFLFHGNSSSDMIDSYDYTIPLIVSSSCDHDGLLQNLNNMHDYPSNYYQQTTQHLNESSSAILEKRISSKKPRLVTSSSSSAKTFKVRKEKLGDRITALQQLVSPFGKTDTASVLHEAIEYIKFLHDQVRVSSSPYLKNAHKMQRVEDHDLRSKGLCVVPISSTKFAAADYEIPSHFWGTSNFYRSV